MSCWGECMEKYFVKLILYNIFVKNTGLFWVQFLCEGDCDYLNLSQLSPDVVKWVGWHTESLLEQMLIKWTPKIHYKWFK